MKAVSLARSHIKALLKLHISSTMKEKNPDSSVWNDTHDIFKASVEDTWKEWRAYAETKDKWSLMPIIQQALIDAKEDASAPFVHLVEKEDLDKLIEDYLNNSFDTTFMLPPFGDA